MSEREIIDVVWFCAGHGNVGIVQVLDPYDGYIYYVGQCSGIDAEADTKWIADWGSRFPKAAGDALFEGI